jgi:hypothetical protein
MSHEKEEWTLYYWAARGRGQYIRVLFADAGVSYKENNNAPSVCSSFGGSFKENEKNDHAFPVFAPPCIQKGNIIIGQTDVAVRYISKQLSLSPKNEIDEVHAAQCMANCQDLLMEFGKHEKDNKEDLLKFINDRVEKWLKLFESPLLLKKDQKYYFGDVCTFADLVTYVTMHQIETIFGKYYHDYIEKKHGTLHAHYKLIGSRKGVEQLYKNDGRKDYISNYIEVTLNQK